VYLGFHLELQSIAGEDRLRVRGADLLRYFGGLTSEETAAFLKMSQRTVEREKRIATAWLYWPLSGQEADET